MNVATLLEALEQQGVELSFEGDRLRFRAPKGALSAEQRGLLTERRDEVIALLRARAATRSETYPLSYGQQAIWLLEHSAVASGVNNLGSAIRVLCGFDEAAIRRAAQMLVDRHATLRTTYGTDAGGRLVQHVAGVGEALVEIHDAAGLDEDALRVRIEADRDRPFDLEHGPMLRVSVYACGPDAHVLLLVSHHIAADGLSMLTLLHELYECAIETPGGATADLPPLPLRYVDHVLAEAALVDGPEGERLWRYWRDQLAPPRGVAELPTDRPRPPVPSFRGASIPLVFDRRVSAGLKVLARETGATAFVVLLASFHMFLARLTGTVDVTVGTSVSQRFDQRVNRAVGDYVNALPVRARMGWSMSFRQGIALLRTAVLEALDAQAYPVQLLVNRLQPQRGAGASPLFTTFFTFQTFEMARDMAALIAGYGDGVDLGGLRFEPYWMPHQSGQFDLTLSLSDFEEAYRGTLNYATDLFDEPTARRLMEGYKAFVAELVAHPDATLAPQIERRKLLGAFNDTNRPLDPAPFVTQFAARAAAAPDACAIRFGDDAIDYATLDRAVNRLARRLQANGVAAGALVGVYADRSIAMVVALLAIQRAGGAYVPLDPDFPDARLAFIVEDSGLALLLSDRGAPSWLPEAAAPVVLDLALDAEATDDPAAPAPGGPDPQDLAYLLYTSGSTGRPNGVLVTHAALSNFLGSMLREPGMVASDTLAAVTTISFDIAALELYLPLLAGATIELLPRAVSSDGVALAAVLADSGATVMQATPATWRMLVEADWRPPAGFRALCGGEPLPADLAANLLARGLELWNLYGPTETTIWSTVGRVKAGDVIDVGRPIANTRIYILDAAGELAPIGVAGEIWIGGAGVAQGYRGRDELTAERFVEDRFSLSEHARMYITGDLGRWTRDGRLVVLGRTDQQVKLRGFRIEPGEIEAALAEHPDVRRAVVTARETGSDVRLVAYVVYELGVEPLASELRRHVRRTLPDYMIPSLFVELEAIPLTPNGKVDRRALPDPFMVAGGALRSFVEPAPGLEQTLADIWKTVLQIERVGANDNFFELGGHSLLSLQVTAALKRETGLSLAPRNMFFQTLRQLSAALSVPELAEQMSG